MYENFDWSPLVVSIKTSLCATVVAFGLGVPAARWVAGMRTGCKAVIDGIFTLPMVLPPTVIGFFLLLALGRSSPVGRFLEQVGARVIFSWEATVIAASVVAFPLVYRTVRASIEQVDPEIIQAARTLGLRERTVFWRIVLPMAWPGVVAGTVLGFARALGEFGATLMIAGNIPGRTQTIPIAIFFSAEGGDMDVAMLWVIVVMVLSFLVVLPANAIGGRLR